jgi:hypothetical protein
MRSEQRAFGIGWIIGSPAAFIFAHKVDSLVDFPALGCLIQLQPSNGFNFMQISGPPHFYVMNCPADAAGQQKTLTES